MAFSHDPLLNKPSQLSKSIIHASESIGNPLFTIWFRPGRTIREALETGNNDPEPILAMLFGIMLSVLPMTYWAIPFDFSPLYYGVRIVIIGAAVGGVLLYVVPAFLYWTGRWLGGDGDDFEARAVYGWSLIPSVVMMAPGLVFLVTLGKLFYIPPPEWEQTAPWLHHGVQAYNQLVNLGLAWTACLIIAGQRETHHIPWWKGAVSLVLTLVLIGAPVTLVILACRVVLGV